MDGNQLVQSTLDAMATNIAVLQGDGRILGVNAAWKSYGISHGFDPRCCGVGSDYLAVCDAVLGEQAECAQAVADAVRGIATGITDQFVMQYSSRVPDGTTEWWVVRVSRYPNDSPVRIVVSHEDITGFQGDADTPGSAEWLRQMIHSLPVGAAYVLGEEIHVNAALERTTGLTAGRVTTRTAWLRALHGNDSSPLGELLRQERSEQPEEVIELPLLHRDGTPRWVQFRRMTCREGELWLFHDLTEYKQIQIALGESEERNRRILEGLPVGVVHLGADGVVEHANARAREILARADRDVDRSGPPAWFSHALRPDGTALAPGKDPVTLSQATDGNAPPQLLGLVGPEGQVVWTACAAVQERECTGGAPGRVLLTLQELAEFDRPTATSVVY